MNGHHNNEHVNGHQPNGVQMNEAELDAYEEQLTNEAIIDQVKTFFAAQEQRVVLYRDFERQHIAGEKSDSEIASVISSATASFNQISQRINRCEIALKDDLNRADLGRMIRRIQGYEKIKFEATIKSQMWQKQEGDRDFSEDIREAGNTKLEAIENINEVMEELRAEIY